MSFKSCELSRIRVLVILIDNSNLIKGLVKIDRKKEREREKEREIERERERERERDESSGRKEETKGSPCQFPTTSLIRRKLAWQMKFVSRNTPYAPLHAGARPKVTGPVLSSFRTSQNATESKKPGLFLPQGQPAKHVLLGSD